MCIMAIWFLGRYVYRCTCSILYMICWPVLTATRLCLRRHCVGLCISFVGGICLAQLYCYFFLKKIPLPQFVSIALCMGLNLLIGVGNACAIQLRCISLLSLAMYCGKPGRGVMKAVILTYVVAGPITNMCKNAREVVRVFACTTRLSYNLSQTKHSLLAKPVRRSLANMTTDVDHMKACISSIDNVLSPIENEVEGSKEAAQSRIQNDYLDGRFGHRHRSQDIEKKYKINESDKQKDIYQKKYLMKLEIRCQNQFARSVAICMNMFRPLQERYCRVEVCQYLDLCQVCNIHNLTNMDAICDSGKQVDPGLGEGYEYLKKTHVKLTSLQDIKLEERPARSRVVINMQDSKRTGDLVIKAFEEKNEIMQSVIIVLNICMAILFLRIPSAAATYHDQYLTDIDHDNTYVTGYFKRIDARRRAKNKYSLLPLKKMERIKYVNVRSFYYIPADQSALVSHVLKVLLEVVTATTFIMLDRLFYEALEVVRQHAEVDIASQELHNMDITVDGPGILAGMVRKLMEGSSEKSTLREHFTNQDCMPRPRLMSHAFFFKIYGGYLWIILLLYLDPYTLRLRRLICSYFYPVREKQRILHLYNDILKNRIKLQKTLRRKAIQAVRAHYLSGENLLSLRMKFPRLLGWLRVLPTARMTCLICGETEPRHTGEHEPASWHSCVTANCPFVYCVECWREVGRCLACDPSLADLSDMDSLSDDDQPRH
ncbi:protein sneaky-like [Plodia interpunctella]|uniref:protein sneaky-like n=1 Tax=Plodia interpunctella TaxID=58824 RepID=UPI002368B08E|nr:protein sneaky-like [Plodia interpunctella]